ncbi:MAG: D-alanine--D-alanine ligase [Candidatus Gastranaerophilales bacterium]|nr:D-alanine--D-alanine ligase [Candidatus Gastranaerophilales bacterium]
MEKISSSLIPKQARIAVLCGGMSSEREVSLRSGNNCFCALQRLGYENAILIDVNNDIAEMLKEQEIEYAYIALHGKYGEDGCIQGLLEILDIPYTGCGVMASAVSMNKEYTKRILQTFDIPLIKSKMVSNSQNLSKKVASLKVPLMVKPVSEGSSIGMAKVNNLEELEKAINDAIKYCPDVMIEEYIVGKSITIGVLDTEDETFATPILEFRTKTEWYNYEAKYTEGMTEFILPANLSQSLTKELQKVAIQSHKAVKATGMSRIDFLIDKNDNYYVLEINTIPGMTDLSDLPAQANSMEIEYDQLVQIILNSALLPKN